MQDAAKSLVKGIPDQTHLLLFAEQIQRRLVADLNESSEPVPDFLESRAKALLRAADLLDEPTRHSFERLIENEGAVRVALFDLLADSGLAEEETVQRLAAVAAVQNTADVPAFNDWLSLAVAAYAWQNGYPLYQLDPASPPEPYSPAGQVLKRAASYVRGQVQRSATERDKAARQLVYSGAPAGGGAVSLEDLQAGQTVAPLPPHYRPPIPVNYPEMSSETIQVDAEEGEQPAPVTRGDPIKITATDIEPEIQTPTYRQPIRVTGQEQPRPAPTRIVTPDAAVGTSSTLSDSVRKKFGRGKSAMKTTKLIILVQERPDGPGLYGLQVRVSCKGIKSYVAGTTTRDGRFNCELPVPQDTGLTYDIDVTWPREFGGETERKSITLNADRTQFTLPFFRQSSRDADDSALLK